MGANPSLVVVDYDAGNLRSVERALAHVGVDAAITADWADVSRADGVILPGVGAASDTMAKLGERSLTEPLREYVASGRPFLGICMGLQALLDHSDEGGGQECLGLLPGNVRHFGFDHLKVPHMGWNQVTWLREHRITSGIPSGSYFYFVHSFYPDPADPELALGETTYGFTFPSVLARENMVATQFHPEKSGEAGLAIYTNFANWVREAA
ncbi:MAG: imidazole glycerol phosphate synthase subunit HisH [Dehalococcoidia bacterium]|nr:imidazole glycerol phosphate synthase subunit HisH [Dehalococcoidia bacterium]MYA53806.1 imidazole glycerol phosphate synthase subunit HisH [Dehalococcoidia bacterium]